jgi:dolichol-phosphate mannosyltransferase
VVPVFNEEGNLRSLHERLTSVVQPLVGDYEIIFVNDGSTDHSMQLMGELAAVDPHVRFLGFTRNFGHESATSAGLDYASGDAVVIIDADLQDPPGVIAEMVQRWEEGYDIVYGRRAA